MTERVYALYRFFAAGGQLLYVGLTTNPARRLKRHRGEKTWWNDVVRIEITHYLSLAELRDAERAAIAAERPRYNVTFNRGAADGAIVAADTDEFVGLWFYGSRRRGRIRKQVSAERYLVEFEPSGKTIVSLDEMCDWMFYDSRDDLGIALGCEEFFASEPCKRPVTHRTSFGLYVCARCARFYHPDPMPL